MIKGIKLKKKKLLFHIRIFVSMSFNFIVILTGVLMCICIYFYVRAVLRESLYIRLNDLSFTVAKNIDGDKFSKIIGKDDQTSYDNYVFIQRRLQDIQKNTTDIFYIYSMKLNEKKESVFMVPTDDDRGLMGWMFVPYEDFPDDARFLYDTPGVKVIESFIKDDYGTWVSGYASILDSKGNIVGVVGVDVSAKKVINSERRLLLIIGSITLVIIFVIVMLGRYFSRMITKPLLILEDEMKLIQKFELRESDPFNTIFIELESMGNVVDNTKKALRSFKKYVPAELVHQIVTTQKEAVLSGEKTEATFMFTDIADFTTISESVKIELLVKQLASYFEGMTSIIHFNEGTVDKYIGDAIMAFWGAPIPIKEHANLACDSALKAIEFLKKYNTDLTREGFPRLDTRFGIHTGKAIIGNMGYSERLNYTAIGDTVNLASRLEGMNKYYGTSIIISDSTYERVQNTHVARKIDRIVVKGKTEWLTIFELICRKDDNKRSADIEFSEIYNSAIELYYDRKWKEAAILFNKAKLMNEKDELCKKMIKNCVINIKTPPSDDWNGVVVFHSK